MSFNARVPARATADRSAAQGYQYTSIAKHVCHERGRDVRDQVAESISQQDFSFDPSLSNMWFRPGQLYDRRRFVTYR